jgi:hypothetical protein
MPVCYRKRLYVALIGHFMSTGRRDLLKAVAAFAVGAAVGSGATYVALQSIKAAVGKTATPTATEAPRTAVGLPKMKATSSTWGLSAITAGRMLMTWVGNT